MPSPRVVDPAPTGFHPEFGYLCPSPQLRRIFHVALVSAAIGVTAGVIAVLALMPRGEPGGARAESIMVAAPAEKPVATAATAARLAAAADVARPSSAAAAKPCGEQTWPYLDRNCISGDRKSSDVRVLRPEEPSQSAAAQVLPATNRETSATESPATPQASEPPKAKAAQRRHKKRTRPAEEAGARNAYATPYERRNESPYGRRYEPAPRGWGWNW